MIGNGDADNPSARAPANFKDWPQDIEIKTNSVPAAPK
jgi:hypothetical protein